MHDLQVPVSRPVGLRAGFHAESTDPVSGLHHAGEQWAPTDFLIKSHAHQVWELYLQLHGRSRWTVTGRQFALGPGHLLAVAPGVVHHMVEPAVSNQHFYFAAIETSAVFARHPAFAERWLDLPPVLHRRDAQALADPFAQLVQELTVRRPHPQQGLDLAVDRLVLEVSRLLAPDVAVMELAIHPAVTEVRRLLDADFGQPWTLGALAQQVGLAPTYLAGMFTREVGQPPHRYLNERRVDRARHLLLTSDLSVSAISVEVGFGSAQHFARVFRQLSGCSPREFRGAATPLGNPVATAATKVH